MQDARDLISQLEAYLNKSRRHVNDTITHDNGNDGGGVPGTGLHQPMKLPCLTLVRFSGNSTEWPAFWTSFEKNDDQRTDLNDSNKLPFLRSVLDGPALDLIMGYKTTDENYKLVVQEH